MGELTRRQLAAVLAMPALAASPQQPQPTVASQQAGEDLSNFEVPAEIEPAVHFKA